MVQWQDPVVQARLGIANMNIVFLLLGLYGWEYFSSLDIEYAVLRRRLAFRWPLLPYIVGRVFLFLFLLLLAIRTNPPSPDFTCLPITLFTGLSGDVSLGCTSLNLMVRTWVIWRDSRLVHTLLLFLVLGHWIVLALDIANLQGVEVEGQCAVLIVHPTWNGAVFVYSLCFDFIVLLLSIVGLSRPPSKSPLSNRVRAQGIVYFVVAMVAYIPSTVFSILGVNYAIEITGVAATTASNIASCRAVRSLLGLRPSESSQVSEEAPENQVALTSHIPIQTGPYTVAR